MPHICKTTVDSKALVIQFSFKAYNKSVEMIVTEPAVDEHWRESPDVLDAASRKFVEQLLVPEVLPEGIYLGVLYDGELDPAVQQAKRKGEDVEFYLCHYSQALARLNITVPESIYDALRRECAAGKTTWFDETIYEL